MRAAPLLLAGFCLELSGLAHAQEVGSDRLGGTPGTPENRLFAPIDYWGTGNSAEKAKPPTPVLEIGPWKIQILESVWAQPIQTPDGTWMLYVPPKPILDFLEEPTEGTASAYLAWKTEQAEKVARAMALLAKIKGEHHLPDLGPSQKDPPFPQEKVQEGPGTLIYFKKPTCPHCMSQDIVLSQWLPKHPGIQVDIVLPGTQPELWNAYGVRGTPTLVLKKLGGKEGVLIGLHSEAQLEAALARLSGPTPQPPEREEKERSR